MAQEFDIYNSQYTAEQIEGFIASGKVRINPTNLHWELWDIATQAWQDTGIVSEGRTTGASWGDITGSLANQSDLSNRLGGIDDDIDEGKYGVNAGGVNLWDEQWELGDYNSSTGQKHETTNSIRSTNSIKVVPSQALYLAFPGTNNTRMVLYYYDATETYIAPRVVVAENGIQTVPSNAYYVRFYITSEYGTTYHNDISINYPSTDTSYHPYIKSNLQLTRAERIVNLLNPTLGTTTVNGVTCTNNGDGTYTLNGTTTASNTVFELSALTPNNKTYKFLGCPSGGSWESYMTTITNDSDSYKFDNGNGNIITLSGSTNYHYRIRIRNTGTVCNNLIFKPMITTNLSAKYEDFVEYGHYTQFGDLLWTNASPSSRFAEQIVSVDLSKYRFVIVRFSINNTGVTLQYYINSMCKTDWTYSVCMGVKTGKVIFRTFGAFAEGVTFAKGQYINPYGTLVQDDAYCIPYQIYGIR